MAATPFPAKGITWLRRSDWPPWRPPLCAVCSGAMVVELVLPDPQDGALELRTYACAECGHSQTYSVVGGNG
jgi:hypothetical protein